MRCESTPDFCSGKYNLLHFVVLNCTLNEGEIVNVAIAIAGVCSLHSLNIISTSCALLAVEEESGER